jgi:hypothetical protein
VRSLRGGGLESRRYLCAADPRPPISIIDMTSTASEWCTANHAVPRLERKARQLQELGDEVWQLFIDRPWNRADVC